ncbi:hypothetical protein LNL84_08785 [Vibrio sp. ZSDZ34]|jgi:hypothetical protein|uniref:Uncharacterized protein n=1 Tax=Vibrio gelatinilyticus TaxID=2893468 RepID=A0A9X2AVJ4_9VIBR|nr:hypothetical protein [Vibrio gelatinilyticus]MCJ2376929.1 hypothetical protein [Vibrio gelatinilyticus]
MSQMTTQQERALAIFKSNIHLPHGGFHKLIVELCKEFQLPFPKVRAAVKNGQKVIESNIRSNDDLIDESTLSQQHWLSIINAELSELAKDNKPVIETLQSSDIYQRFTVALAQPLLSESDREQHYALLCDVYEFQVYKPLTSMLHTTTLFWEISNDLDLVNEQILPKFSDYPQHVLAIEHILALKQQLMDKPLV